MSGLRRFTALAFGLILLTGICADGALAQGTGGGAKPPTELSVTYGSMWGGNIQALEGKFRTATGPSWGFAIDVPVHPAMSVEVSYTRQDGGLDWDSRGTKERVTDMSVNYWQIGAIRGLIDGKVRPFVSTSLGVTHYGLNDGTLDFDGETYNVGSATKFSFVIGVGVKSYFGEAEKIGLRASMKFMPTLYNTGAGIWVGGGGASLGITGNAIVQWEAAIGLTVKLGG